MVDFAASVEPEVLEGLKGVFGGLEIGGRASIDAEERGAILNELDGNSYKLTAGGSLSNTLVALSLLCSERQRYQHTDPQELGADNRRRSVSIACSLGSDPLGEFYRTQLMKADVQVLSEAGEGGTTGSVIVLTTPDAHRTMLSCWGTSATLPYDDTMDEAIAGSGLLVIEGYLWEMPETIASIRRALATAKRHGVTVALTASDASCVHRHGDAFWALLREGLVDVLLANRAEVLAMTGLEKGERERAVRELGRYAKLVVMTDGSHGAYLMRDGKLALVPPHWSACKPVDTCGAGDAFAAGCLYGLLHGAELPVIGAMGARVASVVISHTGARLSDADARLILQEPLFTPEGSSATSFDVPGISGNDPLCIMPVTPVVESDSTQTPKTHLRRVREQ